MLHLQKDIYTIYEVGLITTVTQPG